MPARLLGPEDEPRESGTVVAVHFGDYRRQEIWVNSGANVGNWYCLGGEFGRPKTWEYPRPYAELTFSRDPAPKMPAGHIPLHPDWSDVLKRGPVTLLTGADGQAYLQGWRAGRKAMWQDLEDATYDDPKPA